MKFRRYPSRYSRRGLLAGVATVAVAASARADLQTFEKSKLIIETAKGKFPFTVELARTEPQMEQGLMFRRDLAADAGMLFEYGETIVITMWMKNTYIPLDMIFMAEDGKVVDYHQRAVPFSLDTIASKVPARAVLEVNSGTVDRLGIAVGDIVRHPFFKNLES